MEDYENKVQIHTSLVPGSLLLPKQNSAGGGLMELCSEHH